jgi:hypothetical protein
MAVNPSSGAADEEAALLEEVDELLELDDELLLELGELLSSSPPHATRLAPINAATAVPRLPFKNWRRWVMISAKVVLLEWFDIGSMPELSIS